MTYEEALQCVLMYCSEECGMIDACRCENKECVEAVVIEALEKAIPKKPARTRGKYGHTECACCGWISVKDELPKEQGYYRVYHKNSKSISDRFYYKDCPELFVNVMDDPITYWKPMEQPPKEGE